MVSWVGCWVSKIILSSNHLKLYHFKDTFDGTTASFSLWWDYPLFDEMTSGMQDTNG
jgi:hypothetical protein